VSYVSRSMILAESETLNGLITALVRLCGESKNMSRYEYLANLTEIATEVAERKRISADEVFKTLASLPREQVAEAVKKMV
jgi:hypothetical protein